MEEPDFLIELRARASVFQHPVHDAILTGWRSLSIERRHWLVGLSIVRHRRLIEAILVRIDPRNLLGFPQPAEEMSAGTLVQINRAKSRGVHGFLAARERFGDKWSDWLDLAEAVIYRLSLNEGDLDDPLVGVGGGLGTYLEIVLSRVPIDAEIGPAPGVLEALEYIMSIQALETMLNNPNFEPQMRYALVCAEQISRNVSLDFKALFAPVEEDFQQLAGEIASVVFDL